MGVLGGAVEQNRGPHLTSAVLIPPSERLRRTESWAPPDLGSAHPAERAFTVYRFRPGPAYPAAVALPSVRRFLTVRTCVWARFEKFPRTMVRQRTKRFIKRC
jgi:hypothetical protein